MKKELNHFDKNGKAIVVDVSKKEVTERIAVCEGYIYMNKAAFLAIEEGSAKKGDVLGVARIAGIMAAKRCSDLIPMCHPLLIEKIAINFELNRDELCVRASCEVLIHGKTGVEMEALCGVNIALLTIYDMCKAVDRGMIIDSVRLLEKQGGKSGDYSLNSLNQPETENLL